MGNNGTPELGEFDRNFTSRQILPSLIEPEH